MGRYKLVIFCETVGWFGQGIHKPIIGEVLDPICFSRVLARSEIFIGPVRSRVFSFLFDQIRYEA